MVTNTKPACLGTPMPEGPTGPSAFTAQTADAAGATAGIVSHLTDRYTELKKACWHLCETYNAPIIDDDYVWDAIEDIEKLIEFK